MSHRSDQPRWIVNVNATVRRPAPRHAAARHLSNMFGLQSGTRETLYDRLELALAPGQIVAVVGPSGAGKSVLLRRILDALPDARELGVARLARSDDEAICAVGGGPLAERLEALSKCGLAEAAVLITPARRLSGGQLYRLALARALLWAERSARPTVIVADEFASNVDDDTAECVCRQVRKWISHSRAALVVATVRAGLLDDLQPDVVVAKPLCKPARIIVPARPAGAPVPPRARRWRVRLGTIQDYRALGQFHYIAGPPAAHKRVYVIRRPRRSNRRAGRWERAVAAGTVAVAVVSPPTASSAGRELSCGGRYVDADGRPAMARLNKEVECISRVVVHPAYRSCGLAVRLVRHVLKTSRAAVVESLAVMGRVHPFFELAGMMSWYVGGEGKYVYYDHVRSRRVGAWKKPGCVCNKVAHPTAAAVADSACNTVARPTVKTEHVSNEVAHPTVEAADDWTVRRPATRQELAELVRKEFSLVVGDSSICPHHNGPLDYLAASFFDQDDLLVWANRGGGKTTLAAAATLLDAVFRGPAKIRVLGGSFDQSDRLAEYIRQMLTAHPRLLAAPVTRKLVRLVGGSEVRMLAQSQRAVRGQHVQKIRCDEVDLFDAEVWRAVQFVTRSTDTARGSIEVLSTLHRPGGLMQELVASASSGASGGKGYRLIHWCLWDVIERCGQERRCDDCLLADDCRGAARRAAGFFRIDDAIAIKARSSRAAWEAEMLCRGAARQYLVFDEFDPARHVAEMDWQADWPTFRAIDFGYRSPLVCLWIQISPLGRVCVMEEYVAARLPLSRHAAEILNRDRGPVVATYVDPAGRAREATSGAACTEMLAGAGIPCTARASTIAEGLELIRAALAPAAGEVSLTIHPRCGRLIDAFNNYHYPPPSSSADRGTPAKDGPDHAIDALRYFFVNRMRPRIDVARKRY